MLIRQIHSLGRFHLNLLSPKHMSVQNGAMDVRQSDATGRMRLTSVISPAHVCVHSTTQARSQDFPRGGGGSYSGGKWTLSLKGGLIW